MASPPLTCAREVDAGCRYLVDASDASHRDLRPAPCAAFCRCSSWLISLGTDWCRWLRGVNSNHTHRLSRRPFAVSRMGELPSPANRLDAYHTVRAGCGSPAGQSLVRLIEQARLLRWARLFGVRRPPVDRAKYGGFPCGIAHRAQNIELVEHSRVRRLSGPLRSFPHGAENIDFIGYKNCAGGIRSVDTLCRT